MSLEKLALKKPPYPAQNADYLPCPQTTDLNPQSVNSSTAQVNQNQLIKLDDRVVVLDRKNCPQHGTVRWVGRHIRTRTLKSNHIGIETVS